MKEGNRPERESQRHKETETDRQKMAAKEAAEPSANSNEGVSAFLHFAHCYGAAAGVRDNVLHTGNTLSVVEEKQGGEVGGL